MPGTVSLGFGLAGGSLGFSGGFGHGVVFMVGFAAVLTGFNALGVDSMDLFG